MYIPSTRLKENAISHLDMEEITDRYHSLLASSPYDNIDCIDCVDCINCYNCIQCTGCIDCINCILCAGFDMGETRYTSNKYYALNKEITKEEFFAIKELLALTDTGF